MKKSDIKSVLLYSSSSSIILLPISFIIIVYSEGRVPGKGNWFSGVVACGFLCSFRGEGGHIPHEQSREKNLCQPEIL